MQLTRVMKVVDNDDFYLAKHQLIFGAMIAGLERGDPLDPLLVVKELEHAGQLEGAGGREYLTELAEIAGTPAHAVYYASTVHEKAISRRLAHLGMDVLDDVRRNGQDPRDLAREYRDRFDAIIADARPGAGQDAVGGLELLTLDAIRDAVDEDLEVMAAGLVTPGMLTVWHSAPKDGKSTAARSLVCALARGDDWWAGIELAGRPVRVLYLSEDPASVLREQLGSADVTADGLHFAPFTAINARLPSLADVVHAAGAAADAHEAELIVIDTLAHWARLKAGEEQDSAVMEGVVQQIRSLAAGGRAVVLIHHSRKNDAADPVAGLRGSSAIAGAADAIVKVSRVAGENENLRRLKGAGRLAVHHQLDHVIEYVPEDRTFRSAADPSHVRNDRDDERVLQALEELHAEQPEKVWFGPDPIRQAAGMKKATALDRLRWLAKDGRPVVHRTGQGYRLASWGPPDPGGSQSVPLGNGTGGTTPVQSGQDGVSQGFPEVPEEVGTTQEAQQPGEEGPVLKTLVHVDREPPVRD